MIRWYVADYPLLPVRRRFWEKVFRAVDQAGTAAQLRNQLTVVYEAVKRYADAPGWKPWSAATSSIGKNQLTSCKPGMLQREIDELIRKLDDGTTKGKLCARLCAVVYLINRLPHGPASDLGIRANADTLADLLVEDLKSGSAELRRQIPDLLQSLVGAGRLIVVDDEFRMQTKESAAWDQEYRKNYNRIVNDAARIADERADQLRNELVTVRDLKVIHGASKVPRKVELFTSTETPDSVSLNTV